MINNHQANCCPAAVNMLFESNKHIKHNELTYSLVCNWRYICTYGNRIPTYKVPTMKCHPKIVNVCKWSSIQALQVLYEHISNNLNVKQQHMYKQEALHLEIKSMQTHETMGFMFHNRTID